MEIRDLIKFSILGTVIFLGTVSVALADPLTVQKNDDSLVFETETESLIDEIESLDAAIDLQNHQNDLMQDEKTQDLDNPLIDELRVGSLDENHDERVDEIIVYADLENIRVIGYSALPQDDFQEKLYDLIRPYAGRRLTQEEQINIRNSIAKLYWDAGYSDYRVALNETELPAREHSQTQKTEIQVIQERVIPIVRFANTNELNESESYQFSNQHESVCAVVEGIQVVGCFVSSNDLREGIQAIIQSYAGRVLTSEEKINIRDALTYLYLSNGYITSRAILEEEPTESVDHRDTRFSIIEGELSRENILVQRCANDCSQPLRTNASLINYVRDRLEPAIDSTVLNANRLEERIRLLSIDPLFERVETVLRRPESDQLAMGQSELVVSVWEAEYWSWNINANNYSPPSIGSERVEFNGGFRNQNVATALSFDFEPSLLSDLANQEFGDRISARGILLIPLDVNIVGRPEGEIQLRLEHNRSEIIQEPFDRSNFRSIANLISLSYHYPISQSIREESSLSVDLIHQDGQTFIFNDLGFPFGIGPDEDGISQTNVISFGTNYVRRDRLGQWVLRGNLNLGTDLFNATTNSGSIPDGQFISSLGQIQRIHRLSVNHLLVAQLDLQLSLDSLLPSQQFVVGGGQSLRGYRENVRSGDNGFRFSIEDRITVASNKGPNTQVREPILQIVPFIDVGAVWNHAGNPNELPEQNFLTSTGLGLLLDLPLSQSKTNLQLRIDYAIPLFEIDTFGNTLQDNGLHFRLGLGGSF